MPEKRPVGRPPGISGKQLNPRKKRSLKDRFDRLAMPEPNTGCWLWTGCVNRGGYGMVSAYCLFGGKSVRVGLATRLAYYIYNGEFDLRLFVLHRCDVPGCVNPDHLYLGDAAQNSADMVSRDRSKKGFNHGMSKLDDKQVLQIRSIVGKKQYEIAEMFGVTKEAVGLIIRRQRWKHV